MREMSMFCTASGHEIVKISSYSTLFPGLLARYQKERTSGNEVGSRFEQNVKRKEF